MKKFCYLLLFLPLSLCIIGCGSEKADEPDINVVDSSLDKVFANLDGEYSATWSESTNDVTYTMTFSPYSSPKNEDIRISDGGNVNYTKRIRIFGRVNEVKAYTFSNGNSYEQHNNDYLYGIESTDGAPYEMVFYPYSSSGDEDFIYGIPTSYYIKDIKPNSFELSIYSKTGTYHTFKKQQ